jgi:hypothetical protein
VLVFVWGHKNGFDPGNSVLRLRTINNHVMLWNSMQSSVPDKVMQTLFWVFRSCGGIQAFQKDGSAESIAYPSFREVLLETWPGSLTGLVHSTAQPLVLSLRMLACGCGIGKVDDLNELVHEVKMGVADGLYFLAFWLSQVGCRTFLRCNSATNCQ